MEVRQLELVAERIAQDGGGVRVVGMGLALEQGGRAQLFRPLDARGYLVVGELEHGHADRRIRLRARRRVIELQQAEVDLADAELTPLGERLGRLDTEERLPPRGGLCQPRDLEVDGADPHGRTRGELSLVELYDAYFGRGRGLDAEVAEDALVLVVFDDGRFGVGVDLEDVDRADLGELLRHLTYAAARAMAGDERASMEPAMCKLFASDVAVWVTQEAQLIHGGWGYSEEDPVACYVVDALVLPIFEGVKPILELKTIARQLLAADKQP